MTVLRGQIPASAGEIVEVDLHCPQGEGPWPAVLILHGFKGFKDWGFFPRLAEDLAAAGIAALRVNASHNGVGLGEDASEFLRLDLFRNNRASYELRDFSAVVEALDDGRLFGDCPIDRQKLGFFGHSRGGPTAILTAAGRPPSPVVTWASVRRFFWSEEQIASFEERGFLEIPNARTGQIMILDRSALDDIRPLPEELDVDRVLPDLAGRLLLVHGSKDPTVPVEAAFALRAFTGNRCQVHVIEGADHVMNCRHPFAGPTPQFEEAVAATVAHFQSFWD